MSTWRSSAQWRPRQFGWFVPTEFPPFVAWLTPCAIGAVMIAADKIFMGGVPPWPERLAQLGFFGGYRLVTLLYSPLWGFPAILAAVPLRGLLVEQWLVRLGERPYRGRDSGAGDTAHAWAKFVAGRAALRGRLLVGAIRHLPRALSRRIQRPVSPRQIGRTRPGTPSGHSSAARSQPAESAAAA